MRESLVAHSYLASVEGDTIWPIFGPYVFDPMHSHILQVPTIPAQALKLLDCADALQRWEYLGNFDMDWVGCVYYRKADGRLTALFTFRAGARKIEPGDLIALYTSPSEGSHDG